MSASQTTSEKCVAADFWIDGITQLNECLRETASNSKQEITLIWPLPKYHFWETSAAFGRNDHLT